MAIHPTLNPAGTLTPQQAREISSWSQQTSQSIHVASTGGDAISTARLPGTSVSLAIPLDDEHHPAEGLPLRVRTAPNAETIPIASATYRRREPLRRDSLKRRDALLKGKEGSRRRQRWENDRLLNNPWVQPPTASDWQIQPTYQHRTVPYYLAPLWDSHFAAKEQSRTKESRKNADDRDNAQSHIPKELRLKLKHARAARGMLRDVEEEIRQFVRKYHEKQAVLHDEGLADAPTEKHKRKDDEKKQDTSNDTSDDDDDEIVFVGRNGQMHDSPGRKERLRKFDADMGVNKEKDGEKMVFESLEEDRSAGFGRWLVHSLASYYGLRTWSVTVGNPARREAYVGINHPPPTHHRRGSRSSNLPHMSTGHHVPKVKPGGVLPQPLWLTV